MRTIYLHALPIALILAIAGCSTPATAQTLPFHLYSTRDGLPSNHITALYQDSRGYLWIGTDNGLSLYDGTEFTNFTTAEGLPNLYVNDILESRKTPGQFWIGTIAGGLVRLNKGRFSAIRVGDNNVGNLYEDKNGAIWCSTSHGVFKTTGDSAILVGETDIRGSSIQGVDSATIGILTGNAMFLHRPDGALSKSYHLEFHDQEVVVAAMIDHEGVLWVLSSDGALIQISGSAMTCHRFATRLKPRLNIPSYMIEDEQHSLWVTTPEGIFIVNKKDFTTSTLEDLGDPQREPSGPILLDREGTIWIGTYAHGLLKLTDRRISRMQLDPINEGAYNFAAAVDSGGRVWVSTTAGVSELVRLGRNRWNSYLHDARSDLSSYEPSNLFVDSRNRLWVVPSVGNSRPFSCYRIISRDKGPSRLEPALSLDPKSFAASGMGLAYAVDRSQHGWFSVAPEGVALVDLSDGRLLRTFARADGLPEDPLRALIVDRKGTTWYGSWARGLAMKERGADSFKMVDDYPALPGSGVRSLYEDRGGDIWIGTRYGGIVRYHDNAYLGASVKNGLLSNAVWSLAETDRFIWCGTDVGLESIEKETCRPLPPKTELLGKRVYACGAYRGEYVWAVVANELIVFEEPERRSASAPAPIYIKSYAVNGVPTDPVGEHVLDYDQNSCTIEFVGVSFRDEHLVRYRYRMLNLDSAWSPPASQRSITYAKLSPGKYVFQVSAINADGIPSVTPAALAFQIASPYWQRSWFIALMVIAISSIGIMLYRYRINRVVGMERLRLRIASDLHDDVGTNLSSIIVASQIIEKEITESGDVRDQLRSIGDVANRTQEMMRDIVWMLNPMHDSLEDFILKMKETASRLLANHAYVFHVPDGPLPDKVDVEFKRNVLLIFKESLNNIVRHAEAVNVVIEIACTDNEFDLTISDDGVGFEGEANTTGTGLANLRRRAQQIGGRLDITSSRGGGTRIRLNAKITYMRNGQ